MIDSPQPEISAAERGRLTQLRNLLSGLGPAVRYVDYHRAEEDCALLAARLRAVVPAEELARFSWLPIPRGGWIVMGMLAYWLDLPSGLEGSRLGDGDAVVLVDDCALSGYRLAKALEQLRAREVIVLHLYSHPELRRVVEAEEPRVRCCLAAHDLEDRSASAFTSSESHAAWEDRWRRFAGRRYWVGQPELLAFAWSEPDRPFRNQASDRVESGWRFVPPQHCLAHRAGRRVFSAATKTDAAPRWRLREGSVVGRFDGRLWLYDPGRDETAALEGAGGEIFESLVAGASLEEASEQVARQFAVPVLRAAADATELVAELEHRGWLERG